MNGHQDAFGAARLRNDERESTGESDDKRVPKPHFASASYGVPTAAGGWARPIAPASTTMVTT